MDSTNTETDSKQNLAEEKSELRKKVEEFVNQSFSIDDLETLAKEINLDDLTSQHHGVIGIRKLLSVETGPPIDKVIQAGLIPILIQFTQRDDQPHLQLEAAYALTNVASGTNTHVQILVEHGIIEIFIKLLSSPHLQIVEQAVWGIGNIAGDTTTHRDAILNYGGAKILSELLQQPKVQENKALIKNGAWALSNLCREKPLPQKEKIKETVPVFCSLLQTQTDKEILSDSLWGLANLSEYIENEQTIIPMGIVPIVLKYMDTDDAALTVPAVRIIGNIASTTEQCKILVNVPELIPKLFKLLDHPKKAIRREVCWTLSNFTSGNPTQIEIVIKEAANIQKLIRVIQNDSHDVQKEAAYTLSNALADCDLNQALRLVQNGVLECFVSLLDSPDPQTLIVVLEGIKNVLSKGATTQNENEENAFLVQLEEIGGVEKIEILQTHANDEVYEKALGILEQFFAIE